MTKMTEVKFYEKIEDELLKFAVIISRTQNQYVFCKHKDRDTWEIPGGHVHFPGNPSILVIFSISLCNSASKRFISAQKLTFDETQKNLEWRIGTDEMLAVELKKSNKIIGNVYMGKRDFEAMRLD